MKKNYFTIKISQHANCRILIALFLFLCLSSAFVQAQVSVTATAATTGPTSYATLKQAFDAINAGTHQGAITVEISASTTEGTTPATLNSSGAGSASYTSVLVRPVNDGISVSGNPATGFGVIQLNGADNVTIDGDNPNTSGTNGNLTINNTAVATVIANSVIRIATSSAVTSADNNTIKNCNLNGNVTGGNTSSITSTAGSSNISFGIYCGGNGGATAIGAPTAIVSETSNTAPTGTTINNLLIDNNAINQCARAIVFNGAATTNSTGVTISNNVIGASGSATPATPPYTSPATTVYTKGIYIAGTNSVSMTGNTVQNLISYIGTPIIAIELASAVGTTVTISSNNISTISSNGTVSTSKGILVTSASGTYTISSNIINNIQSLAAAAGTAAMDLGGTITSGIVELNKITTVNNRNTGTEGATGINLAGGTNVTIRNNFVSDITMNMQGGIAFSTLFGVHGIKIGGGTGHKVYHNSVNLFGLLAGTSNSSILTSAFTIAGTGQTGIDVRNNIFSNTITGGTTSIAHVTMCLPSSGTSAMNLKINNNAYYTGSTAGVHGIAHVGATYTAVPAGAATYAGLYTAANFIPSSSAGTTNLRFYTNTLSTSLTNDNASYGSSLAAPFTSPTDLHLIISSSEIPNLEQKGDPTVGLTNDIDNETRPNVSTTNPDIGADEVVYAACTTASGGALNSVSASACVGQTYTMSFTGGPTGSGLTYQWKVSLTSGSGYVPVSGGSGATTTSYTTGVLTAGTYYYVLTKTCSGCGPCSEDSPEFTLTVYTNPTITVSPTSATYCNPGTPVILTALGGTTYSWSPSGGLSASTGSIVSATPTSTTTYTVTGSTNGCTGTATSTITTLPGVTLSSVTATPANVCSGGSSTLTALGSSGSGNASSYIFTASSGTFTSLTGGNALAINGDQLILSVPIGFSFKYCGNTYTTGYASSNGFLSFNPSAVFSDGNSLAASASTQYPLIAPLWDDLSGLTTGAASYLTTGVAGSRIFTFQWLNWKWNFSATAAVISFQIKLYESDNHIEFIYRQEATAVNTASGGASIGLGGTIVGNYLSLNGTGASPTASSAAETTTLLTKPATGQVYSFMPPAPNYSWSPGTFLNATTGSTVNATSVTSSTTYTVVASISNGCSATGNVTVNAGTPLTCGALTTGGATTCVGVQTVNANPSGGGLPYTYAWTVDGNSNNASTSSIIALAGSHSYSCQVTDNCNSNCSSSLTVVTNSLPAVSVSPTSGLICNPGGTAITINANGASTYSWTPSAGLNSTTGSSVSASPIVTTTYTVSGTDGNGCINSAISLITVGEVPQGLTATATPSAICSGATSNLASSATLGNATVNNYTFSIGTGATLDPMTGATTVLTTGNDDTPTATPVTIGFNFNYNGTVYSQYSVSPDGWILLGSTTAASQFTNTTTSATNVPKIYPYWDDLATGTDGNVKVLVTGSAPSRIFKVQWQVTIPRNTTGATNSTFQAWLYEGSGQIEFRYGTMGVPSSGSISAGLTGSTATNFNSITFSTNTASGLTANDLNTTAPSSGRIYTFNPPGGGITYAWEPSASVVNATSQNTATTPLTSTTVYTVTATNGLCSVTATTTVSTAPLSCQAATTSATLCSNTNFTVTSNVSGGGTPYSYVWSDGTATVYPSTSSITANLPAGSYTFTSTVTDACNNTCSSSVTVTVNGLPSVTVSPSSGLICNPGGSAINMNAGGAVSYSWSPTTGLTSSTGSLAAASPSSSTTYTITGTDGNGCVATTTAAVSVSSAISVTSVIASNPSVCSGGSSTLTATGGLSSSAYCTPVVTGNPGATGDYLNNFSFANITNNASGDAVSDYTYYSALTANVVADGTTLYNISLQAGGTTSLYAQQFRIWIDFNQNGIFETSESVFNTTTSSFSPTTVTGTTTIPATAYNGITRMRVVSKYSSTPAATESCTFSGYGEYEDYNVSITGGVIPLTYSWSPSNFLNSITANPVSATGITSTTTWTVTLTEGGGCSATGTVTVTAGSPLTCSSATTSSTLCENTNFTVTAHPAGGGTPYIYLWSDGSANSYPSTSSITANLPAGTYTFTGTVTDACGSSCVSSVTVTVNANPAVSVSPTNGIICTPGGSAVTLTAGGATAYTWSPAAGLTPTTGSTVSANPATSTTYTVTGTDGNGCINQATSAITVAATPQNVTATATPSLICSGSTSNLTASANLPGNQSVNNYTFSAGSGSTLDPMTGSTTVINSSIDDTPTAAPASIGFNFNYNGTIYSQYSVSPDGWILLGGTTAVSQFTNTTTSATNVPKIYPYWDDLSTGTNGSVKTLITGTTPFRIFMVQWNVAIPRTSATGDAANSTFQAWLYETTNVIEFRYGTMGTPTSTSISSGLTGSPATSFNSITFSSGTANGLTANDANTVAPASGTVYTFTPPVTVLTYSWSPSASVVDPTNQNTVTTALTSTTIYTVTVTNDVCSATATTTVNVDPLTCSAATVSSPLCENTNFTVTAHPSGGGSPYSYAWSDGSATSYPGTASIAANLPAGTYTFTGTVTDACNNTCASSVTVVVNALPPVVVSPTNGIICSPGGSAVTLTAGGATAYTWSPAAGLTPTTGSTVSANPATSTTYTVTGTDGNGCINRATSAITVAATPQNVTATATPSLICSGSTSNLTASANLPGSQSVNNYTFSSGSGSTLDPMTGSTTVINSNIDDTPTAAPASIGFNFNYNGTIYSQYSVSPDGWILLGGTTAVSQFTNTTTSATNVPKIYPYWDDLATGTDGNVMVILKGSAPFRVLIVQWQVTIPRNLTGISNSTFQAWLYETTNVVEFKFGTMGVPSGTISSGLTGSPATSFNSITFSSGTASGLTANDANTTAPASGTVYTFTPPAISLSYSWSPSSGVVNPTSQATASTALTTTTTYTVTVSNSGCSATGTVTVNVDPLTCSAATASAPLCANTNFTVTAHPSGGGSPYSYAWSDGTANIYPGTESITANLPAGTYTFTGTVTDACNNTCSSSVTVVVNTLPPVVVSPTSGVFCTPTGSFVTITASGATSYTWSPLLALSSTTGSTVVANPSSNTVYSVTGTDGNGCVSTATSSILAVPIPVITSVTATPASICSGGTSNLNVNVANSSLYNMTSATFGMLTATGTVTSLVAGDELVLGTAALPFPFSFFGTTYSTAYIHSNGFVSFSSGQPTGSPYVQTIPNTLAPNNFIALSHDDLNATVAGSVKYFTNGTPGSQIFVIEFNGVKYYNAAANNGDLTGQIQIFEADNHIEIHVQNSVDPTLSAKSLGIENSNGTIGYSPATRNNVSYDITTPEAWSFVQVPQTFTYNWTPGAGLTPSSNVQNPTTAPITSNTTYTVTVSDVNGCSTSGTTSVSIASPLACTSITASLALCAGTNFMLTSNITGGVAPISYAWSDGAGGVYASTSPVTANLPAGSYTFSVIVTDGCGATCSSSLSVTVNGLPTVSVNPTSGQFCNPAGTAVTLSATGATSYTWSPAAGINTTNGSTVFVSPASSTIFTVTGTDGNGCSNTATATIQSGTTPSGLTASATPSLLCSGAVSQLTSSASIPASASVNNYSFSAGTGSTLDPMTGATIVLGTAIDDTPTGAPAAIGFSFVYNGTTYTSYSVSPDGWILLGNTIATAQFTNAVTSTTNIPKIYPCWDDAHTGLDGNVEVLVTGTAPNRVFIVQWQTVIPRTTVSSTTPSNSTFQAWLYETSNVIEFRYGAMGIPSSASAGLTAGATNFKSITYTTNTASSAVANDANVSAPVSGTIYSFTPPVSTAIITYSWAPAGNVKPSSTIQNPLTDNLPSGETIFTVTATNNGCSATATTTVTVESLTCSPASVSTLNPCSGTNFTVTANSTGGGAPFNYSWNDGNGGSYPNAASITANLASGTYTFECTITDGCSGSCTSSVSVTVNPTPSAFITSNSSLCSNNLPILLTANDASVATSPSYQWKKGGVNIPSATNDMYNATTTGSYTVEITAGGCSNESAPVVIYGTPASLVVAPLSSTISCGGSTNLSVISSYNNSFTNSNLITIPAGAPTTTSGNASPYPSTLVVSGVPVGAILESVSLNGITHTFPTDIDILLQSPTGTNVILLSDVGGTTSVTGANLVIQDGAAVFPATLASGTYAPTNVTTPDAFNAPGPGSITQATPTLASFGTGDMNGTWNLYVVDDASLDVGSMSGWSLNFQLTTDPSITYSWSPSAGLNTSIGSSVIAAPAATTTYTVTGTNLAGCTNTATSIVTVTGSCGVPLYLKVFIEGYYEAGGTSPDFFAVSQMRPCLYLNEGAGTLPALPFPQGPYATTDCDYIEISAMSDLDGTLLESQTGLLQVDGTVNVSFTTISPSSMYYIRLVHRNALETWSSVALDFSTTSAGSPYDFTTAKTQAFSLDYGLNGMHQMSDGPWAILSGDMGTNPYPTGLGVQDGNIDSYDFNYWDADNSAFNFGYLVGDLNGDVNVDSYDYNYWDVNNANFEYVQRPF